MTEIDPEALAKRVSLLKREGKVPEAIAFIDRELPDKDISTPAALKKAELLHDLNETERAYTLYEALVVQNIDEARYEYARRLYNRGLAKDAQFILAGIGEASLKKYKNYLDKINKICDLLEELEGETLPAGTNTRIIAMKHAILSWRHRQTRALPAGRLGRLSLCTGSLGSGGAERQISRLAIEISKKYREKGEIGGLRVEEPVELIIRSLSPELKQDFFLQEVLDEQVDVVEIAKIVDNFFDDASIESPELRLLLSHLPPVCNYGIKHLVPHLRQRQPDYLSVWQDGACLMVALAALIAGVPRIQLGLRGLPPVVRKRLFKPEYEPLYQALAEVPGVDFMSNNHSVTRHYAEWLQLEERKFQVVYNGVVPPATEPSSEVSHKIWQQFLHKTPDADTTIGGVFRFVGDKSPFAWIDFAADYLKQYPASRFILVGDGELRAEAQQRAEQMGILERILFVGVSRDVGFWLQKMNVFMLFSRYEGLPNVLIEAQMVGVPVISTPAGGAAECFIEGVSGYILDDAQKVNLEQACRYAEKLANLWRSRTGVCDQTQLFLQERFSVENMVASFIQTITTMPK
ncbi:Vi polysaccharide biosynthesis glycosyltransferase TviE [Salmonella enterica]|nr:Vi polysaccharide biosynthesis glycosyltransferase TviE [Salmonella enterica]EJB7355202.1 Vi polysaccharide biosynthesis glycosyltransferase TviE [Salmonella enterica]EKJ1550396.1 Vi polysaccharide biosynthesis glycosyltransferase TviE [Salmonella enterica]EMB9278910.1 Vi polysaccharide biosynthesis glycosyltransferase TviE [Salmonella enterica]